jgi:hypothetical protein
MQYDNDPPQTQPQLLLSREPSLTFAKVTLMLGDVGI